MLVQSVALLVAGRKRGSGMPVKDRRARLAMTQEQLAIVAGVSRRTVQYMEARGVGGSPARNVAKVARCLGCTVEDLIGEEDGEKK